MKIHGKLFDVHKKELLCVEMTIDKGKIAHIAPDGHRGEAFILPGFVDAHVHLESSLLTANEFARVAVRHGTVAVAVTPTTLLHVLKTRALESFIESTHAIPFKFFFGAPSLKQEEASLLLNNPSIFFLAEVMDTVDQGLFKLAKEKGKPIDGHAPSLHAEQLLEYVKKGIQTDHECSSLSEAKEKIQAGMKILIREGSLGNNFSTLLPILKEAPSCCMFCSDHLQPDHFLLRHINHLVKKAVQSGVDPFIAVQCASKNPIEHYRLPVGMLRVGDPADFILVEDLKNFRVLETYINGVCVFKEETFFPYIYEKPLSCYHNVSPCLADFSINAQEGKIQVIEVQEGQSLTKTALVFPKIEKGKVVSDLSRDLLKVAVLNPYIEKKVAVGFVKNFGLKKGAIGASFGHNTNHLVAIGSSDEELSKVLNALLEAKGGIAVYEGEKSHLFPLPLWGIFSLLPAEQVAQSYADLELLVKNLGSPLKNPLMLLKALTHLFTPELKMSDEGLFDTKTRSLTSLFVP